VVLLLLLVLVVLLTLDISPVAAAVVKKKSKQKSASKYAQNYYFACNLGGDNWLAIVNAPCSRTATLTVPPNSRLVVTGTVSSSCGTYSTVYINDVNAGYVEQRYLCKPRNPFIRGDEVIPCSMPSSWDFLNLFRAPYTDQPPIGQLRRNDQGVVIDGPAYNGKMYMVKVYNRSLGQSGWVDATYLCFLNGNNNSNDNNKKKKMGLEMPPHRSFKDENNKKKKSHKNKNKKKITGTTSGGCSAQRSY